VLAKGPDQARAAAAGNLQHWQEDTDFAGVRGPDALAKLPEAERAGWRQLWVDVADTLTRAQEQGRPAEKKPSSAVAPRKD
jgi:hypothetical protein